MNAKYHFWIILIFLFSCHQKSILNSDQQLIYQDEDLTFINFNNQALYLPVAKKDSIFQVIKENKQLQKLIADRHPYKSNYHTLFLREDTTRISKSALFCSFNKSENIFNSTSLICFDQAGIPLFTKMTSVETSDPSAIKCRLFRNMNTSCNASKNNKGIECYTSKITFNISPEDKERLKNNSNP